MSLLLEHKDRLDDPSINWLEDHMQAHTVMKLRQHPYFNKKFTLAGDQNAGKRSKRDGAMRKACGMSDGEPDMRVYIDGGLLVLIEYKRKRKGRTSPAQTDRQELLSDLGFNVFEIWAESPVDAYRQTYDILFQRGFIDENNTNSDIRHGERLAILDQAIDKISEEAAIIWLDETIDK